MFASDPIGSQVSGISEGGGTLNFEPDTSRRSERRPNLPTTLRRYAAAMFLRSSGSVVVHCPGYGYVGCRRVIARFSPGTSSFQTASLSGSQRASSGCCPPGACDMNRRGFAATSRGPEAPRQYVTVPFVNPEPLPARGRRVLTERYRERTPRAGRLSGEDRSKTSPSREKDGSTLDTASTREVE